MKITLLKGNPRMIRVETSLTMKQLRTVNASDLTLVDKETKAPVFTFDLNGAGISKYGLGFKHAPETGAIVLNYETPTAAGTTTESVKIYLGTVAANASALETQITKAYKGLEKAAEAIEVEE